MQKHFYTNRTDDYKITININNIKSILELGYFNFWLSRITYNNSKQNNDSNNSSYNKLKSSSSSLNNSTNTKSDSSNNSLGEFDPNVSYSSSGGSYSGGVPDKKIQKLDN